MKRRDILKGTAAIAGAALVATPVLAQGAQALTAGAQAPRPRFGPNLMRDIHTRATEISPFFRSGVVQAQYLSPEDIATGAKNPIVEGTWPWLDASGPLPVKMDKYSEIYAKDMAEHTGNFDQDVLMDAFGAMEAKEFNTAFIYMLNGMVSSGQVPNQGRLNANPKRWNGSEVSDDLVVAMNFDTYAWLEPHLDFRISEKNLGYGAIGNIPVIVDSRFKMQDNSNAWLLMRDFVKLEMNDGGWEPAMEYVVNHPIGMYTEGGLEGKWVREVLRHRYQWRFDTQPWQFTTEFPDYTSARTLAVGDSWSVNQDSIKWLDFMTAQLCWLSNNGEHSIDFPNKI